MVVSKYSCKHSVVPCENYQLLVGLYELLTLTNSVETRPRVDWYLSIYYMYIHVYIKINDKYQCMERWVIDIGSAHYMLEKYIDYNKFMG